jgi:phosphoserine phosphatase RsbX
MDPMNGEGRTSLLSWASAGAPLEAGTESGDRHVVVPFPNGTLVAMIDGLGHGPEAAAAAKEAARILTARAGEPVLDLMHRCHEALRRSRGAVVSIASFDGRTDMITWLGVGNVEGILLRAPGSQRHQEAIMLRGGVVGFQLPPLRTAVVPVFRGDTLILSTDGIRDFSQPLDAEREPHALAQSIFARCGKGTDDALVLVARYTGGAP